MYPNLRAEMARKRIIVKNKFALKASSFGKYNIFSISNIPVVIPKYEKLGVKWNLAI